MAKQPHCATCGAGLKPRAAVRREDAWEPCRPCSQEKADALNPPEAAGLVTEGKRAEARELVELIELIEGWDSTKFHECFGLVMDNHRALILEALQAYGENR